MPGTQRENPRREYIRHTVDVPLEVESLEGTNAHLEQGVNVSYGGLAFYSRACPQTGEAIRIRIPTVKPPFEASARVAWCRREGEEYLVGVQFTDAGTAFRSRMVQQVCSIENYRRQIREEEGRDITAQEAAAEWIERYAGAFPESEVVRTDGAGGTAPASPGARQSTRTK